VPTTVTIKISDELSTQLAPYRDNVDDLLRIGLREVKMAEGLALFKEGDLSLWKAARLAGVSLREMIQYAVAQGLRPTIDEETVQEELT
jgi:predicted HTH domain antitoxin